MRNKNRNKKKFKFLFPYFAFISQFWLDNIVFVYFLNDKK